MNPEAEGLLAAASKGLCPLYLLFPGPGEIAFLRENKLSECGGKTSKQYTIGVPSVPIPVLRHYCMVFFISQELSH